MTIEKATFGELVDILTYANYKHNRQLDPSISAERWEKVYGPSVYAMEKKFQEETNAKPQSNGIQILLKDLPT